MKSCTLDDASKYGTCTEQFCAFSALLLCFGSILCCARIVPFNQSDFVRVFVWVWMECSSKTGYLLVLYTKIVGCYTFDSVVNVEWHKL